MIENQESIYKTLIKVNQIGKKLSPHSKYILSNGIMMSHNKQEMSDIIANPVSIAIIDNSLHKKLAGIGDIIGIKIDGNLLYKYSQEYEFDNMEVAEDGVNINFVYYSVNEDSYNKNFREIPLKKGFTDIEISYAAQMNYTSNMDMYDLFLTYKKNYEPVKEKTYISILCKYANQTNFLYKKSEKIINLLNESELVYGEDMVQDIFNIVFNSNQPVTRKFELSTGETIKIRLMKSLFNPVSTKSTVGINIYKYKDIYILTTRIDSAGITVFNVYQILNF
mgnify:CR=1 FL=1